MYLDPSQARDHLNSPAKPSNTPSETTNYNAFISSSPVTPVYPGTPSIPVTTTISNPSTYQNPLSGFRALNPSRTTSTTGAGSVPVISTGGSEQNHKALMNTQSATRDLAGVAQSIQKEGTEAQTTSLMALTHVTAMKVHMIQVKSNLNRAVSVAQTDSNVARVSLAALTRLHADFISLHIKMDVFEAQYKKANDAINTCVANANKEAQAAVSRSPGGSFSSLARTNATTAAEAVTQMSTIQASVATFARRLMREAIEIKGSVLQITTTGSATSRSTGTLIVTTLEQAEKEMTAAASKGDIAVKTSTRASELASLAAQHSGSVTNSVGANAVLPRNIGN
jgi:hypothetical protein